MNVMTTFDPYWCVDMSGTNANNVIGPVHTYAKFPAGTDTGLIIYNGLDQDFQWSSEPNIRKIWVQELQQPFNPSNLPCGHTVVGITLSPASAMNYIGQNHTVTATLSDLLGDPQPNILVTFTVTAGPNVGVSDTDTTDENGQATFDYSSASAGTDVIVACFTDEAGNVICSQPVDKIWIIPMKITLEPSYDLNVIGQDHTVTATVLSDDQNEDPQPGIVVTFIVTSGPNAGLTGQATTDANGQASFTYTSILDGEDVFIACITDQLGDEVCALPVTKEW
ncbi:MAG: Ig-like domain-containing protein, partial [Candidatus Methanoperedens sp.]|nr:Ig-like domain-containing protein [Candidatus Methanoperedens sp.]